MIASALVVVEQISREVLVQILAASLKGSLLVACVYVAVSFAKGMDSRTRHLVWFLSLSGFVLLPLLSLLLQPVEIGIFQTQLKGGNAYQAFTTVVSGDAHTAGSVQSITRPALQVAPSESLPVSAALRSTTLRWTMASIVWLVGALATLSRTISGGIKARRIVRNGRRIDRQELLSLLDEMKVENGVHASIQLSLTTEVVSPFTHGVFRPAIVLPAEVVSWPRKDIAPTLLHELHHIRRMDCLTQIAARLICALFWFVPVVWIALNKLYEDQENACDLEVVRGGIQPAHYAGQMLKIAYSMLSAPIPTGLFMVSGRRKLLEGRLVSILENRTAAAKPRSVVTACIAYAFILSAIAGCVTARPFSARPVEFVDGTPRTQSINTALEANGLDMRLVPIFDEGATATYRGVMLSSYALSEAEVTQGDFEAVSGPSGTHYDAFLGAEYGDSYPVYFVTWFEAAKFCNDLSELCGFQKVYDEYTWEADFTRSGFYLPTEAQWEHASGGPDHFEWSLGDTFNASDYVFAADQWSPVKSRPPNGYGLYDMSGNVYEWCHDWHGEGFPQAGALDPSGPACGSFRAQRGGSWRWSDETQLRAEWRGSAMRPSEANALVGFRVAAGGFGNWN